MRSEWSHIAQQETVSGPPLSESEQQDRAVGAGLIVGGFLLPAFALASYLTYHEPPRDYMSEAVAKQVNEAVAAQITGAVKSIDDGGDIAKQFTISGRIDGDRLIADINAMDLQLIEGRRERRQVAGLAGVTGAGMSFAGAFLLFRRRGNAPANG